MILGQYVVVDATRPICAILVMVVEHWFVGLREAYIHGIGPT